MRSTLVFCLFLLGGCDIFQPASIPDGNSDQNDTCEKQVWYVDFDGDGYGTDELELLACDQPSGSVDIAGDCDDMDPDINPSAEEICDGLDNDCNGVVDDNVISDAWYVDADGDGYGNADMAQECNGQDFLVTNGDDCDDLDATISPDASEICDNIDNDCDGMTDDQDDDVEGGVTWYGDTDGDGYGNVEITTMACLQPTDFVAEGTDCNDNDVDTNPGATEYCDEQDNDCDGEVDEGLLNTYYADNDGDGYGDAVSTVEACLVPSGFVVDATDCNDADASVNPGAEEICDDIDNNCDGQISEGLLFTWVYADDDGDGFGNNSDTSSTCNDTLPTEYGVWVWDNTDCDDTDPAINPNADEYCDGVDNDCDGSLDESDALDASTWYADSDSDGYGDAENTMNACEQPFGYLEDNSDCDDADAGTYPGALEVCGDGVDQDCDGTVDETDCLYEGVYEGSFSITVNDEMGWGLSDVCEGDIVLDVDVMTDPMIEGNVVCTFSGALAYYYAGDVIGTVEADILSDLTVEGEILSSQAVLALDWDGEFSDSSTISSAFTGTGTFMSVDYSYDGSFEVVLP